MNERKRRRKKKNTSLECEWHTVILVDSLWFYYTVRVHLNFQQPHGYVRLGNISSSLSGFESFTIEAKQESRLDRNARNINTCAAN